MKTVQTILFLSKIQVAGVQCACVPCTAEARRRDVVEHLYCLIANGVGNAVRMQTCSENHKRNYALTTETPPIVFT